MESTIELKARLTAALHEIGYLRAENKRLQQVGVSQDVNTDRNIPKSRMSTADNNNNNDESTTTATTTIIHQPSSVTETKNSLTVNVPKENDNRKVRLLQYELDKVKEDIQASLNHTKNLETVLSLINSSSLFDSMNLCHQQFDTLKLLLSSMGILTEKHILRVMNSIQKEMDNSLDKINLARSQTRKINPLISSSSSSSSSSVVRTSSRSLSPPMRGTSTGPSYTETTITTLRSTVSDLVKENDGLRLQVVSLRKQITSMDTELAHSKENDKNLHHIHKLYQIQRNTLQNIHEELLAERLQTKHLRKLLMESNISVYSNVSSSSSSLLDKGNIPQQQQQQRSSLPSNTTPPSSFTTSTVHDTVTMDQEIERLRSMLGTSTSKSSSATNIPKSYGSLSSSLSSGSKSKDRTTTTTMSTVAPRSSSKTHNARISSRSVPNTATISSKNKTVLSSTLQSPRSTNIKRSLSSSVTKSSVNRSTSSDHHHTTTSTTNDDSHSATDIHPVEPFYGGNETVGPLLSSIPEQTTSGSSEISSPSTSTSSPTSSSMSQEIAELISQGAYLPGSSHPSLNSSTVSSSSSTAHFYDRIPSVPMVRFAENSNNDDVSTGTDPPPATFVNTRSGGRTYPNRREEEIPVDENTTESSWVYPSMYNESQPPQATLEIFKTLKDGKIKRSLKHYNYTDPWLDTDSSNDASTGSTEHASQWNGGTTIARVITPVAVATAIRAPVGRRSTQTDTMNTSVSSIHSRSKNTDKDRIQGTKSIPSNVMENNYGTSQVDETGTGYVVGAAVHKRPVVQHETPKRPFANTHERSSSSSSSSSANTSFTKPPLSPMSELIQRALDAADNYRQHIQENENNNYNNSTSNNTVLPVTMMVNDSLLPSSSDPTYNSTFLSSSSVVSPASKNVSSILPFTAVVSSPFDINNYSKDSLQQSKIMSTHKPRAPKDVHKLAGNNNTSSLSNSSSVSLNASSIFALSPTTPVSSAMNRSGSLQSSDRKLPSRNTNYTATGSTKVVRAPTVVPPELPPNKSLPPNSTPSNTAGTDSNGSGAVNVVDK